MKIALICRSYWDDLPRNPDEECFGGEAQQLAEAVAAHGHEVVVLSQSPEVGALKRVDEGKLELWVSPSRRRRSLFSGLRDQMAKKKFAHYRVHSDVAYLREFMKKRGPFDVAWAPNELPDGIVAALAAQRGVPMPPLLTQVQNLRQHFRKQQPIFDQKPALRLVFRRSARLIACSDQMAEAMANYAGSGLRLEDLQAKTHVMHPVLKREFMRAAFDESLIGPWPDRVLFLGKLDMAGGVLVFMKAILKAQTALRSSTFVVAGGFRPHEGLSFEPRWEDAQEAVATQVAAARTEYLGQVSTFEVARQIKMASLVVVPALFSPFGRGVVEALALGRPVVVTDQVGSWGIVQNYNCGMIVPPYNSTALAQAIDHVLASSAIYAANADHIATGLIEDFSPETTALHLVNHLSDIARR